MFRASSLEGVVVVTPEARQDDRGWFARTFCYSEFLERGLNPVIEQCSVSFNLHARTLRGMHYQASPHEECKLVRCPRGAIYDVVVDLRSKSPTYLEWFGVELTEANALALYIPEGVAHGFLTVVDNTEVLYQMSTSYVPSAAKGVRWDDPAFAVVWPEQPQHLSDRDRLYPDLNL